MHQTAFIKNSVTVITVRFLGHEVRV